MISIVVILITLISIILNVYFYLSDDSEIAPRVNDNINRFNISNTSDENEIVMHRIARVTVTPGSTIEID